MLLYLYTILFLCKSNQYLLTYGIKIILTTFNQTPTPLLTSSTSEASLTANIYYANGWKSTRSEYLAEPRDANSPPRLGEPNSPSTNNNSNSASASLQAVSPPNINQFIKSNVPVNAAYKVASSLAQASKIAASNSALKFIVVSDGEHHAVFEKGATKAALQQTLGNSTWGANFKNYVPMVAFDKGSIDITSSFTEAVKIAGKLKLGVEFSSESTHNISNTVLVPMGVKYIHGNDSALTAKGISSGQSIMRLYRGISDIEVDGFTLNLNHANGVDGILVTNANGVNIHDINFVNGLSRAINIYTSAGDVKNVVIENNTVSTSAGTAANKGSAYGFYISNTLDFPAQYKNLNNPIWQQFIADGTVAKNPHTISGVKISNNQIDGGYYGINLSGVSNSEVSNNAITNNMRNISLQNNASGNIIKGNYLSESTSSSIHVAYNSDNNKIHNNTIVSKNATGQSILQAYQGSDNNAFINNSIEILNKTGPGWAMYAGTGSNGTTFKGNIVDTPVSHAVVGVEAIWDSNSTKKEPGSLMIHPAKDPRVSSKPITYNGGTGTIDDVSVDGNIFLPKYAYRPFLYVGADKSTGATGKKNIIGHVTDLSFSGNKIFGTAYSEFIRIHENGASVKNMVNQNNSILKFSADHYVGTAKSDTFFVDHVKDVVTDKVYSDSDTVYSSVSYTLSKGVENLHLIGQTAIIGNGNNSHNILTGNAYNNVLKGFAGNDQLIGGYGSDTLTGGLGKDTFVFDAPVNGQVDRITDFSVSEDKIALSKAIFGKLSGDWFAEDKTASAIDTRIIQNNNKLYYDADGSGKYFQPIQFAELHANLPLTQNHFELI